MRYNIHPRPPHRNLAAGKRSIVLTCASIALVLGTTSAGSSSLFVDDPQASTLPPTSSIPATADETQLVPSLPLSVTAKPLGKQQPLIIAPQKVKPAGLKLESVPEAAAAVLVQLSKHAPSTATTVPATTAPSPEPNLPTPEAPIATPDPTTPETPTSEPPATVPTEPSESAEPPAQTLMDTSPPQATAGSNEAL